VSARLVRHRRFKTDVNRVFIRIGEENFAAANRFLDAVDKDVRRLADMPGLGARRTFRRKKLKGLRSLPVSGFLNYLIFYRVQASEVQLFRLIHGARQLERALLEHDS
jgi:toxin ParE1/3/4